MFRDVRPDDTPQLVELYRSLSPESTYRRFFTASPPHEQFVRRLTSIADRGGFSIVVLDLDAVPAPTIVAEADVEPLANGAGEMAVTVSEPWRGWLGPYLVSLLRDRAARRGFDTLEAVVLTCNRPMRALTRRYGEARVPERDWESVRVVFASADTAPSWPRTTRPRVLVELRAMSVDPLSDLVDAGYDVLACGGRPPGAPPCPMSTAAGDCPLARDADAIVVAVPDAGERERLVAAHRARHPDVPVAVLELGPGHPLASRELIDAVEAAIGCGTGE